MLFFYGILFRSLKDLSFFIILKTQLDRLNVAAGDCGLYVCDEMVAKTSCINVQ